MPFKDPEKMKTYMRERRAKEKVAKQVNKNIVNPTRKPVNRPKYLLSYYRNKYQYTLYIISPQGQKSLVQSFHKNSIFSLPCADIELTWGPEVEA